MFTPAENAEDAIRSRDFDLFISYRRKDVRPVLALADALVTVGLRVWIDQREIGDFDAITDEIRAGIAHSKALLAWYSADYPKSRPCQQELTAAFIAAQRLGDPRKRVLVVNPEANADHVMPVQLADQQHVPALDASVLAARIATAVRNLKGTLGANALELPHQYGHRLTGSSRFVGRLRDLWAIHSGLFARESSIISANVGPGIVQVTGLGGIGKSLLAEEYALRFASAFPGGIFCLRAAAFEADVTSFDPHKGEARRREQFRSIAAELRIDTVGLGNDKLEVELAAALQKSRGVFLWIVDDLAPGLSADDFRRWVAPNPNGRTLVTTRTREYSGTGTLVPLMPLTAGEAVALLTARRRFSGADEKAAAEDLCEDLGFHPLALDVTGSALVSWPSTIAEFRRLLAEASADELELAAQLADTLPNGHEKHIAATLLRSIRALGREGQDFLRLAARVAAFPIPAGLLENTFREMEIIGKDALRWTALALAQCGQASLAEGAADAPRHVHVLVARTMRLHDVDLERQMTIHEAAVRALTRILPDVADVRTHKRLALEVSHARALVDHLDNSESRTELLGWVARYDVERGEYALAETEYRIQLSAYETLVGKRDARTLLAAGDLARALKGREKRVEAMQIEKHVLKERIRLLGRDHVDTVTAMNNLAVTLGELGDNEAACRLQQRVLETRLRFLGSDHEHTLFALNNLGGTLTSLGRIQEALSLLQQAYDGRKKVLGDDHVGTLISRTLLAVALWEAGDANAAEQHLLATASTLERLQGPSHVRTLTTKTTLGRIMISQGRAAEAAEFLRPIINSFRARLGDSHQATLVALNNYGKALALLKQYDEARPLQEEAVRGQQQKKISRDWLLARFALNLAETYVALGDDAAARKILVEDLSWLLKETNPQFIGEKAADYARLKKLASQLGA